MNIRVMNEPFRDERGWIGLTWVRCGCPTLWLCVHGEGFVCGVCREKGHGEDTGRGRGYYPLHYTRVAPEHVIQLIAALSAEQMPLIGRGEFWTPEGFYVAVELVG